MPEDLRGVYDMRDLSGDAHRSAYIGLLSTVDLPHPTLAEAVYDQIRDPNSWIPYRDARAVIDLLGKRGIQSGLISNAGFDLRPILCAHEFNELAENCTLSYEVGAVKPDPRIFEAGLRNLLSDPTETLMVGDHPEVDRGAEALGIRTLILPMSEPGDNHGLAQVLDLALH